MSEQERLFTHCFAAHVVGTGLGWSPEIHPGLPGDFRAKKLGPSSAFPGVLARSRIGSRVAEM